ncbi:uncharacterized protein Z520_03402 [Fonsecaea multimorphosa CBS 102226]|uniref:Uncharacterized protein n=1 Tax=Fonsecaea multimorphosa CBS 102226 TaxID=1442371 RepID=A0A0D2IUK3_9EURO|nr:uncharacterized protein Z520_03402 [Fonsecaea multimorphosa CBS 102226]KIY00737.1 hypothetical protein Z520_03402 [Fonsecaea multimorphosa CBS 102226]
MSNTLSSSTRSTVRRAARRDRQARQRARRLKPNVPLLKTPRRRGPKRRKLREQDSLDLDSCSYACEDRGYHLDADVRIGLETNQYAIPYWVSGYDITDPTVAVEEPRPPESSAVGTSENVSPAILPETKIGRVVFKRKDTQSSTQSELLTGPASPSLPSIPTTANATPKVRIPFCDWQSSMNGRAPEYHPDYLNDVRIPSPLLYHNSPFDYVRPSNERQLTWSFELACGQPKPEPDFSSYRPVENRATQDERTHVQRHGSLGFAICTAASSRHKAEASHISDESHDSSTHGVAPLPEDCLESRECAWRNQDYSRTADVNSNQTVAPIDLGPQWYDYSFMRTNSHGQETGIPGEVGCTGDDLIFPTLPTLVRLEPTLAAYCSTNNTVQPDGNQAANSWERAGGALPSFPALTDNAQVPSVSDTVEAAIRAVRRGCEMHSRQLSPDRKDDEVISDEAQPSPAVKAIRQPCMDLVPARLYKYQFITWPASTSAVDARQRCDGDMSGVLRMVNWLEGLNTPDPDVSVQSGLPGLAPRPCETNSDYRKAISTSEATLSPAPFVHPQHHGALSVDEPGSGRHDEGYFTCSELFSEVDLLEDPLSDEEWAHWDWDFEPDDVDERIGLFATEWEAAIKEAVE